MGLQTKNFNILGVDWKSENQSTNLKGGLPKKRAWTVCRFKGRARQERGGHAFAGGTWYPNAHYGYSKRSSTELFWLIFHLLTFF